MTTVSRPHHNCATDSVFLKAAALAGLLLRQQGLVLPQASTFYRSLPGRVTRHITVSTVHMPLPAHNTARCSISLSVFAFVTFQFSDGRTAECAAASRHHMVESLLLHRYPALSTTLSPTVTSCANSTSSAQPLASTQESNGTASSGPVSSPQLPHNAISSQVPAGPTRNVTGNELSATLAEAATALQPLNCSSSAPAVKPHPTSRCSYADFSTQRFIC